MRLSIWAATWLINTVSLFILLSSIAEPLGLPMPVHVAVVLIIYAPLYLFYLRCPVCHTLTSGWRLMGEGPAALYFSAPLMNPGRCGRCKLDFHEHAFGDDLAEKRFAWRRDHP